MNVLRCALVAVAALLVTGCASLQTAGRSEYSIRPLHVDGQTICCEVYVESGREIAHVHAELRQTPSGPAVVFDARGLKAFEGQAVAAQANADALATIRDVLPEVVAQAVRAALGTSAIQGTGVVLDPP